ncbi:uncharacterized protein LOC122956268 [Acropora millepora]|uniref:uncharacterized protein LOC122956268 n=1 Tax=Acropora millepora TaxID=45264 RepID=UPI001CF3CBBB|nr:uncharacterized protein LOC122956268 [Acropora millepora]
MSEYFTLKRGVRQGDPLPPYLFVVAIESLAIAIRKNQAIKGIMIGNEESKLLQYADDMTAVLSDISSAKALFDLLEVFKKPSGLMINTTKTEGMWIGSSKENKAKPLALPVYNRSLSAYQALWGQNVLQLPHSKTLKQIIKDGSEKSGIDEEYLYGQHKAYVKYQKEREEEGHPRPLGRGVMMWDEVTMKVAWNLKGGGITGLCTSEDELKVLHDVLSAAVQPGAQKKPHT